MNRRNRRSTPPSIFSSSPWQWKQCVFRIGRMSFSKSKSAANPMEDPESAQTTEAMVQIQTHEPGPSREVTHVGRQTRAVSGSAAVFLRLDMLVRLTSRVHGSCDH